MSVMYCTPPSSPSLRFSGSVGRAPRLYFTILGSFRGGGRVIEAYVDTAAVSK